LFILAFELVSIFIEELLILIISCSFNKLRFCIMFVALFDLIGFLILNNLLRLAANSSLDYILDLLYDKNGFYFISLFELSQYFAFSLSV